MILELLEYLLNPCPVIFRSMGYLSSTTQVQGRYRRCRKAWTPHLEQTRRFIREVVNGCSTRRKVVVLGAGMLHDIPLEELAQCFQKVVLVDAIHPWPSRLRARRFPHVEQVSADVTDVMEQLHQIPRFPGGVLPQSYPMRFVDDSELDLTLSINLLSQLPYVPRKYLGRSCDEATLYAFSTHLVEAHLDYLLRLPGHTALTTDRVLRYITQDGKHTEEWDNLYGVGLPPAELSWEWRLAPSPEVARGIDVLATVVAYFDWKKAMGRLGKT